MKEIRVGLLGCGTVGTGVVKWIQENADVMAARTGIRLTVTRILERDLTVDRGISVPDGVFTTDAEAVLAGENVDLVVELIGGTGVARTFVLAALNNGKPVITANKALLAYHGDEIYAAARANSVDIYYEASVGGGVPIIKALREGLVANNISAAYGILNGTCNYILTRMEREGAEFDDILRQAQELGYAEAEPSLDVDGDDTAHKVCVLGSLVAGKSLGMDALFMEGIRQVTPQDIQIASDEGYRIKLLGIVKLNNNQLELRVHPTLVPKDSMIGSVMGVYNAVFLNGDAIGNTMLYGPGAGQDATASSVIADIIDVSLNLAADQPQRIAPVWDFNQSIELAPVDDIVTRHYVRLALTDEASALAKITEVFGEADISLAAVIQHEAHAESVPVVVLTHPAREGDVNAVLAQLAALDVVAAEPVRFRMEDLT